MDNGKIENWGWRDAEEIFLNGDRVYSAFGVGVTAKVL